MYFGHGMGLGWIPIVAMVLAVVLAAVALIATQTRRPSGMPPAPGTESPAERILADRYARGEIDAEEYEQRLRTLRSNRPAS